LENNYVSDDEDINIKPRKIKKVLYECESESESESESENYSESD
jgi:hypothetical protein